MRTNIELATLNTDTKTKYINGDFLGAPRASNEWQSLGTILKKALVEGFYSVKLTVITLDTTSRILELTFDSPHSFLEGSVIKISNTGVYLDGDYRVLDYSSTTIKVLANPLLPEEAPLTVEDSSTVSLAPLGYEILYDELSTTGKIVFKNKSTKSPAVLRVVDAVPPNGYDPTWAKFARVVIGQNMSDIDTFVNDEKSPVRSGYFDAENTGDNVEGSTGIHGYAKWYYALYPSNASSEISSPPDSYFPGKWKIIGDDKTFYLLIKPMGTYSEYTIYSFGNYTSNLDIDTQNILLHASFAWNSADADVGAFVSNHSYSYGAAGNIFTRANYYGAVALFKNSFRGISEDFLGYHFGLDVGEGNRDYPSDSSSIQTVSSNTGKKLTSPIFIKDKNLEYRGYLRGVSQIYGQGFSNFEGIFLEDSNIILSARKAHDSNLTNDVVPYLFSLKDWD